MVAGRRPYRDRVVLAAAFIVVSPVAMWAYVDPGTGSYLFQFAVASMLAGLFTVRRCWAALKGIFHRDPSGPSDQASSSSGLA